MSEDLDHREASAIWLLQELARRTGTVDAAMPVVFSSSVGVGDRDVKDLSDAFPAKLWGISQTPQVLLDNQITEADGGVLVSWDAVEELFRDGVLDAMFESYVRMLDWLVDHDWTGSPPIVPASETDRGGSVPAASRGAEADGLMHEDLLRRCGEDPERVALLWPTGSMTYGRLLERVGRVAAGLVDRGVRPGDTVGIALGAGPEQVVAAIATLYAGAVYLAVDPSRASREQTRWYHEADVVLVIATEAARPGRDDGIPQIGMSALESQSALPTAVPRDRTDTAYHVVSSSPDGEPSLLSVSHLTAGSTIRDLRTRFAIDQDDRVLAVAGLETDLSVFDVFGLLGAGGALIVPDDQERNDPAALARLAGRHRATVWNGTPSQLDLLLAEIESGTAEPTSLRQLRLAVVSQERVSRDLPHRLRRQADPHLRFVALGAGAFGLLARVAEFDAATESQSSVSDGAPLAGRRLRVVDADGRDRPDWVVGELWTGGLIACAGDRQAASTSTDLFVDVDGRRWHRTGTRARHLPDGGLEFLGDASRRVDVGGRGVELDEVEAAAESHPQIVRAVVANPAAQSDGRPQLIALIRGPRPDDLGRHLADRLPPHATPTRITYVDALPLTSAGTVDHDALSDIVSADDGLAGLPAGEIETRIAEIWSEILGAGVTDRYISFFSAGGDSLSALRLVAAVSTAFGVDLSVRAFLTASTLSDLTLQVESAGGTSVPEESGVI